MKRRASNQPRAGRLVLPIALALAALMAPAFAQEPPTRPPEPGQTPPGQPAAPAGAQPSGQGRSDRLPTPDIAEIVYEDCEFLGTHISATMVKLNAGEYVLTGDRLEGDFENELVFTGNPTLTYREQTITGDSIRFRPKTKTYRVDNLHTVLSPDFLRGRLTSPLLMSGQTAWGRRDGTMSGEDADASTCDRLRQHYLFRARAIDVEPGKRIVLHRAKTILWGKTLFTLPTLVIPLTEMPRRHGYMPEFGRSADEGWFVKSAFSYQIAKQAPGMYRVDLMERKGIGLGFEQDWRMRQMGGMASLYMIPLGPSGRNLSGRMQVQTALGGGQTVRLSNDFQQNSYLSMPETTTFNTRFGYQLSKDWISTGLNLARQATDSSGYQTRSYTAGLTQGFRIGRRISIDLGGDYTHYRSGRAGKSSSLTEQLVTRLRASERATNYTLEITANRRVPIGSSTSSYFSGVEKVPEVSLTNYRFTQGFLSQIRAQFNLSAGRYKEGTSSSSTTSNRVDDGRVVAGFEVQNLRYKLTGSTDVNTGTSFQQYFYGTGAAQYLVRNNTTLTEHWNKRSGIRLNYSYQQPQGGTPFRFDVLSQYHTLNADIGVIDDSRVQFTARAGYDFVKHSSSYYQPWQTVSANLLLIPVSWARLRNLFSFDPNDGKLTSITSDLRLRGTGNFALDLVTKYDPQRHRAGQINGYLSLPIGRVWRVESLMQYNGYLGRFESRNLQVVRDFHCLEASFTYSENPFGYRADRQIYFQLSIKGLPMFRKYGVGPFGQALDTSVGETY